ncbi:MAG: MFS transporter [Sedimentisphaerales bacterium]|nr:MFS transporter [Sedimentisphaerales bacterium]
MRGVFGKNLKLALHDVRPLYGAAFTMAISLNAWWTTMPFIVRNIGGSEDHVGYAWAANMLGYLVCLLLAGTALGRHNPKNTTRIASVIIFVSSLMMSIVVYMVFSKELVGNITLIWTVIAVGTVAGAAMALFWPFLMSWVSEDFEGPTLNRRLGTYNGAWSSAALVGPMLGGILVEANTVFPIVFAATSMIFCFLLLNVANDGSNRSSLFSDQDDKSVAGCENIAVPKRLRWMARISLFSSWACLGVTRSQFALLFTDLGYSETCFGIMVTIFGICNFAMMTAVGRSSFWHFKSVLLLAVQVLLSVPLFLIIYGRSLSIFALSLIIMGCGFGFAYSSHLYYGACGSKKRSIQMVIHETTLSLGIVVGSGAGGYFAKNLGLYWPYWFALILLAFGFIIQLILLQKGKYTRELVK